MADKDFTQNMESEIEPAVRRRDSLIYRLTMVFIMFGVLSVICCGIATYILQTRIYREQVEKNVRNITDYLQSLIKADGMDFVEYQNFLISHKDEINIPIDYDGNYLDAEEEFVSVFQQQYPGLVLGKDIAYEDLSNEVKMAHAIYTHEYWLTVFESAAKTFNVKYTYYVTPTDEPDHVYYVIDGIREKKTVDGREYIDLCTDIEQDRDFSPIMWKTYEEGESQHTYDVINNKYGNTYAFYSPLIIEGKVQGLICVDVEIDTINREILKNSILLTVGIGAILFIGSIIMMALISRGYIVRLHNLLSSVKKYTETKNVGIGKAIAYDERQMDEIGILANQISAMILELDKYMKNLMSTSKELSEAKQHADELQALANRDSLTGIRNRTAYDEEIKRLEWEAAGGKDSFGIALVDLNYLKRTNEEYGPEKGNIAIKRLCYLVCDVFHHSPVFRIGDDEFVVILKNRDFDNVHELVSQFNEEIDKLSKNTTLEPWERISAAIGVAIFDQTNDFTVDDVFKRATENMFKKKREMKAEIDL